MATVGTHADDGTAVHNVRIAGHRTSVRLEPEMWEALNDIAARTGRDLNDICTEVHRANPGRSNFTSGLRVYILNFYRRAMRGRTLSHVS